MVIKRIFILLVTFTFITFLYSCTNDTKENSLEDDLIIINKIISDANFENMPANLNFEYQLNSTKYDNTTFYLMNVVNENYYICGYLNNYSPYEDTSKINWDSYKNISDIELEHNDNILCILISSKIITYKKDIVKNISVDYKTRGFFLHNFKINDSDNSIEFTDDILNFEGNYLIWLSNSLNNKSKSTNNVMKEDGRYLINLSHKILEIDSKKYIKEKLGITNQDGDYFDLTKSEYGMYQNDISNILVENIYLSEVNKNNTILKYGFYKYEDFVNLIIKNAG